MYYVYILESQQNKKLYVGFTNNLRKRFEEHNKGLSKYTRGKGPFELVYYEAYRNSRDARKRERRLKQFKNGYRELIKRLEFSLLSTKVVGDSDSG